MNSSLLEEFHQRRVHFDQLIRASNQTGNLFTCPSCGFPTPVERGVYNICPICFWEDDGQDEQDADIIQGGPSQHLSLTKSRLVIGRTLQELEKSLGGTVEDDYEAVQKALYWYTVISQQIVDGGSSQWPTLARIQ